MAKSRFDLTAMGNVRAGTRLRLLSCLVVGAVVFMPLAALPAVALTTSTIAGRPQASVPRNSTPNTPSTTTMHAPDTIVDCATRASKSVAFNQNSSTATMTVTGSDPDGGDLTMTFSLHNRGKTRVSSLSVGPIATSGSDGVVFRTPIPSTLSDGSYFWTARLSDGSKTSRPSGKCYITLDSVAPLQPKITSTSFAQGTLYPWDTSSGSFTMAAAGASAFQYSWNGGSNTTTVPVNSRSRGVPAWTGVVPLTFSGLGSLTVTAVDPAGNRSPQSEAFVVRKGSEPVGAISGTVTDAGGTHQGLANARVDVQTPAGDVLTTTTAADGTYLMAGLNAGEYFVCFNGSDATNGASDTTGHVDQCYDRLPSANGGPTTPVVVTAGATTTGVNAALAAGGAVSGTVTKAGSASQGLANVQVIVSSFPLGASRSATTGPDGSYTAKGLPAGTDYSVCFFGANGTRGPSDSTGYFDKCWTNAPGTSTSVTVAVGATTSDIDATLDVAGAISGTVNEATAGRPGLANVSVSVFSLSGIGSGSATTAADGSYTVPGLAAAADYQVCFSASDATGGSSDATGHVDQCYDNQPTLGTLTPVSVALGDTTTGINASLPRGGAISGTVTEGGASQPGLGGVSVSVSSSTSGTFRSASTSAGGSYTITGLGAADDYQVCFSASGATGGSSDATGYVDQCYDAQPISGTPTPVAVTAGVTTSDINAVLVGAAAMLSTPAQLSPAMARVAVSQ